MNLLEQLRVEMNALKITKKEDIKDYIYKRTGQIFNYDPLYIFGSNEVRAKIYKKRLDMRNVEDLTIVCFAWSYLYVDLLREFNIVSKVVDTGEHAYVISYINGETYFQDLMNNYEDLSRIKFGMNPLFNIRISNRKEPLPKVDDYTIKNPSTNMERKLVALKQQIEEVKRKYHLSNTRYIRFVFETIIKIIEQENKDVSIISGSAFVRDCIRFFTEGKYKPNVTYFYNNDTREYIKVYTLDEDSCYYVSRMSDGKYEFRRASDEEIDYYLENFNSINQKNLNKPNRKNAIRNIKKEIKNVK